MQTLYICRLISIVPCSFISSVLPQLCFVHSAANGTPGVAGRRRREVRSDLTEVRDPGLHLLRRDLLLCRLWRRGLPMLLRLLALLRAAWLALRRGLSLMRQPLLAWRC